MGYSFYWPGTPNTWQLYDAAIAVALSILRELCGAKWKPLFVQFAHQRPEDPGPYRRLFGSSLRFNGELSGIAFSADWLDQRIAGADPAVFASLVQSVALTTVGANLTLSEQVLRALHQLIPAGSVEATRIAWPFGIRERTLRRRQSWQSARNR